ncbi:MAG: pilus assembly protein PilP [Deltaproteobacteria bacterium]|nr:pilus assembly protein PilP [Deltaproteobacteria bacterium]
MKRSIFALMSVLLLVVMTGCEKKEEAVVNAPSVDDYSKARAAAAAGVKTAPAATKKEMPVAQAQEAAVDEEADFGDTDGFLYDPDAHRDPFRSFVVETLAQKATQQSRGPLEYFDLSQLKLVAVIVSQENPHALVYDPSGKGYIVSVGTKIGKRQGHIVEMSQSSMTVQETQEDVYGDMTARNIEMKIRHSKGG